MASGQGYETTFAQVVAAGLGIDPAEVTLHLGNTDVAPYGMGSRGARGGTAGGSALHLAARDVAEKALQIAAQLLNLNTADQLRLGSGAVERLVSGNWTKTALTLASLARTAYLDPLRLPAGLEPGLEAHRAYDPPPITFSNATPVSSRTRCLNRATVLSAMHRRNTGSFLTVKPRKRISVKSSSTQLPARCAFCATSSSRIAARCSMR
jgi:hypothetical protein